MKENPVITKILPSVGQHIYLGSEIKEVMASKYKQPHFRFPLSHYLYLDEILQAKLRNGKEEFIEIEKTLELTYK